MLYENDNYAGRSFETTRVVSNLKQSEFNDITSSIEIRGGAWQICDDASFGGRCETLEPGRYPSLREFGLNDRVSSLRPAYGKPGVGSGGSNDRPEVKINRNGAGGVYCAADDCRVIYDPNGRRTAATGQCNQDPVRRADDEMARYRRERGFQGTCDSLPCTRAAVPFKHEINPSSGCTCHDMFSVSGCLAVRAPAPSTAC